MTFLSFPLLPTSPLFLPPRPQLSPLLLCPPALPYNLYDYQPIHSPNSPSHHHGDILERNLSRKASTTIANHRSPAGFNDLIPDNRSDYDGIGCVLGPECHQPVRFAWTLNVNVRVRVVGCSRRCLIRCVLDLLGFCLRQRHLHRGDGIWVCACDIV